ncbi:hypothetical protein HPCPY1662_1132 [Helicobacter pylori CPY1662]|nr:hypothetical protein HPCPY1662_1132 [Helicobacter pylori CPY1662]
MVIKTNKNKEFFLIRLKKFHAMFKRKYKDSVFNQTLKAIA